MFKKYRYVLLTVFLILTIASAALIPSVKINYDSSSFLPSNSETKQALAVMEREFGTSGSLYVMVDNITSTSQINQIAALFTEPNIVSKDFRVHDNKVLFNIVFSTGDYDTKTDNSIASIIQSLSGHHYTFYMSGQSFLAYHYNLMMQTQIPRIILFLVPIALLILILMTRSYFEPILFIAVILFSIIMNMGTNSILPSVSYMTYSVASILQFALCMDYSIILLNRYQDVRKSEPDSAKAIGMAWRSSIVPILSSSLTTVAGFVALMFMRYKIGLDIGLVLSKGVILTLITVLFLMPSLILIFEKLIHKTRHRSVIDVIRDRRKNNHTVRFIFKTRFFLPVIALILIIAGFIIQRSNTFEYSDNTATNELPAIKTGNTEIESNFNVGASAVILIAKNADDTTFLNDLQNLKFDGTNYITQISAYDYQMTAPELSELMGSRLSASELNNLMAVINMNQSKATVSFKEITNEITSLAFAPDELSANDLAAKINVLFPVSADELNLVYTLAHKTQMSLTDILTFLQTERTESDMETVFAGMISADDISKAYTSQNVQMLDIINVFAYYNSLFTTAYDAPAMTTLLQPDITSVEVDAIYRMMNTDQLSLTDIVNYFIKPFSEAEIKAVFSNNMDPAAIENIFAQMKTNGLLDNNNDVTLKTFIRFVETNMSANLTTEDLSVMNSLLTEITVLEGYQPFINMVASSSPMLNEMNNVNVSLFSRLSLINPAPIEDQFVGSTYQRIILSVNLPDESSTAFAYYAQLKELLSEHFSNYYIISGTTSVMDIKSTSESDYLLTTILSVIMVFIIIMILFKSLVIPVILVLVIEGAIFINMSIPAVFHQPIVFMGYIIVSCIQLGATIDYGILVSYRYLDNRKTADKKSSLANTLQESLPTILTSGSILTVAGLLLGFASQIPVIVMLGRMLGYGAIVSMILVIFVLPQILYLFDKQVLESRK